MQTDPSCRRRARCGRERLERARCSHGPHAHARGHAPRPFRPRPRPRRTAPRTRPASRRAARGSHRPNTPPRPHRLREPTRPEGADRTHHGLASKRESPAPPRPPRSKECAPNRRPDRAVRSRARAGRRRFRRHRAQLRRRQAAASGGISRPPRVKGGLRSSARAKADEAEASTSRPALEIEPRQWVGAPLGRSSRCRCDAPRLEALQSPRALRGVAPGQPGTPACSPLGRSNKSALLRWRRAPPSTRRRCRRSRGIGLRWNRLSPTPASQGLGHSPFRGDCGPARRADVKDGAPS